MFKATTHRTLLLDKAFNDIFFFMTQVVAPGSMEKRGGPPHEPDSEIGPN